MPLPLIPPLLVFMLRLLTRLRVPVCWLGCADNSASEERPAGVVAESDAEDDR